MLLGDLSQRAKFVNPGIHRQHIKMSGLRRNGCVSAVEVGEVGGIAPDRRCIAADLGDCFIQLRLATAGNKHPRAFLRETLGDAEADPGAAAGNERDFACKLAGHRELLIGISYCSRPVGTFAKSCPRPSAIVGCAMTASRSFANRKPAIIAVCTTVMTSPASAPIIVKPRMRSSLPTRTFMKPCVSSVVSARKTELMGSFATRAATPWCCASLSLSPT